MEELFSTTLWDAVHKKPESTFIIRDLICNNNNLIVSESDEFRTRFILQMVIDMMNPNCNSFLEKFNIDKRQGRYSILYINTDNAIKDIASILRDLIYGLDNQLVIEILNNIHFIDCYDRFCQNLSESNFYNLVQGVIENENPDLIVIDSFYGLSKYYKNQASYIEAMNALSKITFVAKEFGKTIILTNNINIRKADLEDALRSSVTFTNWSDNIIWLKKVDNENCTLKKIKSGIDFLSDNSETALKFDGKRLSVSGYYK